CCSHGPVQANSRARRLPRRALLERDHDAKPHARSRRRERGRARFLGPWPSSRRWSLMSMRKT
ncbi:MAG: hypothetical protein MHM6MM_009371, partial [Cercozoa sp. M6MM]